MLDNSFIDVAILTVLCAILVVLSVMLSMKILKEKEEQARIAKVVKKTRKESFKEYERRDLGNIKLPHQVKMTCSIFKDEFNEFNLSIIKQKQDEFHKSRNTYVRVLGDSRSVHSTQSGYYISRELDNEYFNIEKGKYIEENKYLEIYNELKGKIKENEDFRKEEEKKIRLKYDLMFEEDWNKNKKAYIEFYKESKL